MGYESSITFLHDNNSLTFVLIICSCLGEKAGCSPAPTSATRDVQNSISTIPVPPASRIILSIYIYIYIYFS